VSASDLTVHAARAPLHVLHVGAGRGRVIEGVEERAWRSLDVDLPSALAGRPLAAIAEGSARIDTSAVVWADVLVLALPLATIPACLDCSVAHTDDLELIAHARETGHTGRRPVDQMVRGLQMAAERDPHQWRSRGIVVDVTDDALADSPEIEWSLIRRLLATADRVIAADPAAAAAARREGAAPDRVTIADTGPAGRGPRLEALWQAAAAHDPARLGRRVALRAADALAAARLAARQAAGLPAWDPPDADDPLVSVVIPVTDEPADIVERAIASALACAGVRLEIVVAGALGSAAMTVCADGEDGRVRRVAVDGGSSARAFAAAVDAASGAWIAPLDPSSLMAEEHPSTLLEVVREYELDAVYAQTLLVADGEPAGLLGSWPPSRGGLARDASLFSAALRAFRPDPDAPDDGDDPCWNLWRRWVEAGAKLASIDGPLALREARLPIWVAR
jgi:hypothetical protein